MNLHTHPDDPHRVAPPYQAPGEKEPPAPREPTAQDIATARCETEQDVLECLKGGEPFLAYDQNGIPSKWSAWELWTVLTDSLDELDTAKTLAGVLDYHGVENPWISGLKDTIEKTALEPFVNEQAAWRLEFAPHEPDYDHRVDQGDPFPW